MKPLIIVESPAKAKKISQLLNNEYNVLASFGHIRDLAKEGMGIDIENNFNPLYKFLPGKTKQIKQLKDYAKNSSEVILAGDSDREGEAISWHIAKVLGLSNSSKRIIFHEITKNALENALKNPSQIDMNLVNAQQARRILDRLVGFEISPVLWKHVQPKLSAGRVQSAVLKLIIDRENDIDKFTAKPYFRTVGKFYKTSSSKTFDGCLNKKFENKKDASYFLERAKKEKFIVSKINKGEKVKKPHSPYTTSSLLQDIGTRYKITSKQIMMAAQKLYEAGKITYHRTDSYNLSQQIINSIKKYVTDNYGEKNVKIRKYKTSSKDAQEAHEAIRPTDINLTALDDSYSINEKKIYVAIWKQTVASQMADAKFNTLSVDISVSNSNYLFSTSAEKCVFKGFLVVYESEVKKNENEDEVTSSYEVLQELKQGDNVTCEQIISEEKFTQSTGRYNEATLIKKMKDTGIGRPSTYSSILNTIVERGYIIKDTRNGEKKTTSVLILKGNNITEKTKETILQKEIMKFFPTDIGKITNEFLEKNFDQIVHVDYTSKMEDKLDSIATGKLEWTNVINNFYKGFHPKVVEMNNIKGQNGVQKEKNKHERLLGKNSSGLNVYVKVGPYGPMVQLGDKEKDTKPKFASLDKNLSIESITLNEALELLEYPKDLGKYQGDSLIVKKGKFGYYISWNSNTYTVNINKNDCTREKAIEIVTTQNPGFTNNKYKKTYKKQTNTVKKV